MSSTNVFRGAIAALSLLVAGQMAVALGGADLARIDLNGDAGVELTVQESSPNCVAIHQNWGDPATIPQRLVVESPCHESEWRSAWVKFTPSKDGYVSMALLGPWIRLDGGALDKIQILYDCISLDGASLDDGGFEKGGAWSMAPDCLLKDRAVSLSGEKCAIVWHNSQAKQRIQVKKGVQVTLNFSFRLPPPQVPGTVPRSVFLDLAKAANMGFEDKVAGDGKGGWSDQGPDNDLALFDAERNFFGAVPFRVVDPAKNGGKSVLTFASPNISPEVELKTATVAASGAKASYLYLLHTCCWARSVENDPVGGVSVKLKDGSVRKFQVLDKRDVGDWWNPGSLPNGAVAFTISNDKSKVGLYLSKFKISDDPAEVESVTFETSGGGPVWIVVGATLSTESYTLPITGHFIAKDSPEWKAADMAEVVVKPGSALDLSSAIPTEPVGLYGRVIVNKEGNFAFEKKPDANIVFLSCVFGDIELVKYKTKEDIEAIAEAIRRQGYNMVRGHFLDFYLMEGGKADFDFNEENLDRFDYFVSCLKKRGIYMYFDAVTAWSAFKKGSGWGMKGKVDFKRSIMALPEIREHWRTGVTKLLTHMNPYTKTRLADDPIIAVMLFYNELEFYSFNSKDREPGLHPALAGEWQAWLKQRYGNDLAALAKAWNDPSKLKPGMKFEDIPLFDGPVQWQTSPYATDAGLFMVDIETRLSAWFEKTVREIGYKGLTTVWDMCKLYRNDVSRAGLPVIAMHNYQAHPQGPWIAKGQAVDQNSSFATLAGYWRDAASTRYADRPLFISEYGHVFWSGSRYEEGLVFGAYSALQGFNGLMVHAAPVCLVVRNPIKPFDAGSDPVERANQVMTAFLFGRHDVSPSKRYIELRFDDKFLLQNGNLNQAPGSENLLALICKFGIWYDNPKTHGDGVKPKPIAVIDASGGAKISMTDNTMDVIGSEAGGKKKISEIISSLKRHGLIPKDNLSDPERRIYQSDTGEILLEGKNSAMTVITPRFEGIASNKVAKRALSSIKGVQSSVPSSTAVISLDGKPLAESSRLLLVYNTDALNSGMELSEDHRTLYSLGKGPTLIKTGILKLELLSAKASSLKVWALGFDGTRRELVPAKQEGGSLAINIDTAKLKDGPTPFFEIVSDDGK